MTRSEKPQSVPGLWSIGGCFNCQSADGSRNDVFRIANVQVPNEPSEFDCIYCGGTEYRRLTPAQYDALKGGV